MTAFAAARKNRLSVGDPVLEIEGSPSKEPDFLEFVQVLHKKRVSDYKISLDLPSLIEMKWERESQLKLEFGHHTEQKAHEDARTHYVRKTAYPPRLLRWFGGGLTAIFFGFLLMLLDAILEVEALGVSAIVLFTLGTIILTVTISRGQEIAGRTA